MTRRVALVVGIDRYALPKSTLSYAVADAKAVATVLSSPPFAYEVRTLLDAQADRRGILRELAAIRDTNADTVIFFFAGHGVATATGTYLLTADAEFLEDGIELGLLARSLDAQASPETSTLAILDCCHSGAAGPRGLGARPMGNADVSRAIASFSKTRAFLAACLPDESSWEDPEVGHGIFTSYLLEALEGRAADVSGCLSVAGIYSYVSKPFEADTRQTPVLRGDLYGDLVIATGLEPQASVQPSDADHTAKIELVERGRALLDSYITLPGMPREDMLQFGFQERCRQLEPIVLWFDKELQRKAKILADDQDFIGLYHSAWAEAGHLAHLAPSLRTPEGTVRGLLGEGTFGSVWRVEVDGRLEAYKVYNPTELRNHEKLTRFRQGYEAMRRLSHPRVVAVTRFTNCPLGFYMNYIEGPNLKEQGPPSDQPSEVIALLLEVAEAIRHAHNLGVIHRDIKPENIIMQYSIEAARFEPHVTDFDLAWFSTATQLTNQAIGALSYAAPEQLAPRLAETARRPTVDVYAFGQLAYFCVTDSPPIPMDYSSNERRLRATLRSRWDDHNAVEAFAAFYEACNQSDPERRPQTMQDCMDMLTGIGELLQSVARDEEISSSRLLEGVAFSLSGSVDEVFTSTSGRTEFKIRLRESVRPKPNVVNLEVRVRPLQEFGRLGKPMTARRQEVNRQIDAALSTFSWASRRSGNHPGFEVFIDMSEVQLRHRSIRDCRGVLDRVLEVMER